MAQIQLSYSAAEIDAAIGKINSLITIVDFQNRIAQLYDNSDVIYPRTRAEAVFFDNDPNKDLSSVMTSYFSAGYLYTGIANPNTVPETPDEPVFWLVFEEGLYENFLVDSYGEFVPLTVTGPGIITWNSESESWVFEEFVLPGLIGRELVFGSLYSSQEFLDELGNSVVPNGLQLYIDKLTNIIYRWGTRSFIPIVGEGGGAPQVQADWEETDPSSPAFIQHKPNIPEGASLANEVTENGGQAVTSKGIYDFVSPIQAQLDALEEELHPYSLTLKVSPTLLEYTGSAQSATFTANFKKNGVEQNPDSIIITSGSDSSNSKTLVISRTNRGIYSGSAAATMNGKNYTASNVSVKIMNALRIGFNSGTNTVDPLLLVKKQLKNSVSGTYTVDNNNSNNYLWICCDDSLSINSVTSSGYPVPMHSFDGQAYITVGGYKCYRSESKINEGQNKEFTLS